MRGARRGQGVALRRWRRGAVLLVGCSAAAACLACAGAGGRAPASVASPPAGAPWELPSSAFPSQRLYQGSYRGPEGGGSFRATLRLLARGRFRLDASDRLGRLLWSIDVDGDRAWWVDHHAGTWCPQLSRLVLPGLGAGPVAATALPALLIGALPVEPASGSVVANDGQLELTDAGGRRWSATLRRGRLSAWTVAEGGEPLWWWRRQDRGGILSQRQGRQLRWQEVVAEPLRDGLAPLVVPPGYQEACGEPRAER